MKRMTFFPGASEALVKSLASKFDRAKEVGEEYSTEVGGLIYSGPVQVLDGAIRWHVNASKLAGPATKAASSAKAKAAPTKKAAPKKK